MKLSRFAILLAILVLNAFVLTSEARAQVTCIQTYLASSDHSALGFAPSDVQKVVDDLAAVAGLSSAGIEIIPCDGYKKVESMYMDNASIPKGEYILYNPDWINNVIGRNITDKNRAEHDQAIFIFAHELGHILGRHFTVNKGLESLQKETLADQFAGCAAGRMGASWDNIEQLLRRLRPEVDGTYPSATHAIAFVKERFDRCSVPGGLGEDGSFSSIANQVNNLGAADSEAILASFRKARASFSATADAEQAWPLVSALVARSGFESVRNFSDPIRLEFWSALAAVPKEWWEQRRFTEDRRQLMQGISIFDQVRVDPERRSIAMLQALDRVKQNVGYVVPPGRLVSAAPFRVRLEYCASPTCDVDVNLRGFDERGALRLNLSKSFKNLHQGEVVDTQFDSNAKLYFEYNQQLVHNKPLTFQIYCRSGGKPVTGQATEIDWGPANEIVGGYATWISCDGATFQVSTGIAVAPAASRLNEGPVLPNAGTPFEGS